MHKGFELGEICSKFSPEGEVMPGSMKDGLRIRIQLPRNPLALPTLLG